MDANWSVEERRALSEALRAGGALRCPSCGGAVARHEVPAKRELPYVRRRVLLICSGCKRSVALDLPRPPA